jgi:hypothetical protein
MVGERRIRNPAPEGNEDQPAASIGRRYKEEQSREDRTRRTQPLATPGALLTKLLSNASRVTEA